ncbi:sulfite exporter TauE/SafE family protein [Prosthecomicrobium sp. N25]|uniref:sulfite exporter TauE/SafE family protein n=1 Tax=Prosthecomicrobium sp. N25 TaxID=3129254 RepID=UPI003077DA48
MSDKTGSPAVGIWIARGLLVALFAALVAWRWNAGALVSGDIARSGPLVFVTGFLGALVATATGSGGGFVYVPVFELLQDLSLVRMTFHQNVATAYVIQVFGMTMGALGWIGHLYRHGDPENGYELTSNDLISIVFTTLCAAVPAILVTQVNVPLSDRTLQTAFVIFGLALGGALLVFAWAFRRAEVVRTRPERFDLYMFLVLGVAGGYVTAFFSVGVGVFLVIYLVFRKFPVYGAVTAAVTVSAVTVAAGSVYNLVAGRVVWEVALAAAPGALLGGYVAHWVGAAVGPLWLKTFAALWITLSSLYLIVRALA